MEVPTEYRALWSQSPSTFMNMIEALLVRELVLQDVEQGRYDKIASELEARLQEQTKAYNMSQRLLQPLLKKVFVGLIRFSSPSSKGFREGGI